MKKYKYLKVPARSLSTGLSISTDRLNKYGEDGWEMVMLTNWKGNPAFIYFKREKIERCKHDLPVFGLTDRKTDFGRKCVVCGENLPDVIKTKKKKK